MESASIAFCYEALRHCYNILGKERFRAETEYIMKLYDPCFMYEGPEKARHVTEEQVSDVLKSLLIETDNTSQPRNEIIVDKSVTEEPDFIELPIAPSVKPNTKSKKKSRPELAQKSAPAEVCQTTSGKPEALQKSVVPKASLKPEASQKSVVPETSQSKWKRTQLPDEIRCQRVLTYNGEQCSFKKEDGSDFCPRHNK